MCENIQVAVRCRPLLPSECSNNENIIWDSNDGISISLNPQKQEELKASKRLTTATPTNFTFDRCFDESSNNSQVYLSLARDVIMGSLNGINGTIFMYGQTGSGKTYNMLGAPISENNNNNNNNNCDLSFSNTNTKFSTSVKINQELLLNTSNDSCELTAQKTNKQQRPPRPRRNRQSVASRAQIMQTFDETSQKSAGSLCQKRLFSTDTSSPNCGILSYALNDLFTAISNDNDSQKQYLVRCSYLEIYNDQVYDLLVPPTINTHPLQISEDAGTKMFYLKNATNDPISSLSEALQKLTAGEQHRHYAITSMNRQSSRSHTIFKLLVQSIKRVKNEEGNENNMIMEAELNFVDLAGSERADNLVNSNDTNKKDRSVNKLYESIVNNNLFIFSEDSGMKDNGKKTSAILKEGKHINKSLFFLTQVISMRSENKSGMHIPYRNSPLTKLMRTALGGNSKTLVVLCINPSQLQYEQSLSTLRFGINAKKIENSVKANIVSNSDGTAFKLIIQDYEKKIKTMKLEHEQEIRKLKQEIEQLQKQQQQGVGHSKFPGKSKFEPTFVEKIQKCSSTKLPNNDAALYLESENYELRERIKKINRMNFDKLACELKSQLQLKKSDLYLDYYEKRPVGVLFKSKLFDSKLQNQFKANKADLTQLFDVYGKLALQNCKNQREIESLYTNQLGQLLAKINQQQSELLTYQKLSTGLYENCSLFYSLIENTRSWATQNVQYIEQLQQLVALYRDFDTIELCKKNSEQLKEIEMLLMYGLDKVKETRIMKDFNIKIHEENKNNNNSKFVPVKELYTDFVIQVEDSLCSVDNIWEYWEEQLGQEISVSDKIISIIDMKAKQQKSTIYSQNIEQNIEEQTKEIKQRINNNENLIAQSKREQKQNRYLDQEIQTSSQKNNEIFKENPIECISELEKNSIYQITSELELPVQEELELEGSQQLEKDFDNIEQIEDLKAENEKLIEISQVENNKLKEMPKLKLEFLDLKNSEIKLSSLTKSNTLRNTLTEKSQKQDEDDLDFQLTDRSIQYLENQNTITILSQQKDMPLKACTNSINQLNLNYQSNSICHDLKQFQSKMELVKQFERDIQKKQNSEKKNRKNLKENTNSKMQKLI